MSPRASSQKAAPLVTQPSVVRVALLTTAVGRSGSSGAEALARRPSHRAVGAQVSTPTVASAASPAAASRSGDVACGVTAATTAAPVPTASACDTNADAAAGAIWTPARCASTTKPATLHTLPGT